MIATAREGLLTGAACVPALLSLPPGETNTTAAGAPKLAVSVSVVAALNVHGLAMPVQVPPLQVVSVYGGVGVPLIVIASPTPALQTKPVQSVVCVASLIATVPLPVAAAVIVTTVTAKFAVTVSVVAAANVHGLVVCVVHSPVQLVMWLAPTGVDVAVIEMLAPTLATQGLAQGAPLSVIETLPRPAVAAAVIETAVGAKFAVTVSVVAAANVHGLVVCAVHSLVQLVMWLAPAGVDVAVIAMLAPTLATQGLAQGAPASVIETLPRPAVAAAVIETVVGTKFAVTVSVVAAANVHGLVVCAVHSLVQLVMWLAPAGVDVAVIAMLAPTLATQGLAQGAPASV